MSLMYSCYCRYCKPLRFLSELGRHNYVTPTSYLELIAAFRLLLTQKRDTVMRAKKRYTNGLDKLAFAESQVKKHHQRFFDYGVCVCLLAC